MIKRTGIFFLFAGALLTSSLFSQRLPEPVLNWQSKQPHLDTACIRATLPRSTARTAKQADTTGCGIIWSEPLVISPSGYTPQIASQGDTLHVTWTTDTSLPYLRSTNDGISWESYRDLWSTNSGGRNPGGIHILANYGRVIVIWIDRDNNTNRSTVGYCISMDHGETWGDFRRFMHPRGLFFYAASMYGDRVTLDTHYETNPSGSPFISRTTDGGETWTISADSLYNSSQMQLALSESSLHIVHQPGRLDITAPETEYRRSTDLGDTWETVELLSENDGNTSGPPSIGIDGKRLLAAYRDSKYGCGSGFGCNILGRMSADDGTTWSAEQFLTEEPFGYQASIAMRGDVIVAAWEGVYDIDTSAAGTIVRVSFDGGMSWCPEMHVGRGGWPKVALTETAIHIVSEEWNSPHPIWYVRGQLPVVPQSVVIQKKWNIVSVPVGAADRRKSTLFPHAVSHAFTFRGAGYVAEETLEVGRGYWLKFPQADTAIIVGLHLRAKEIPVIAGWNMVGAIGSSVSVNDITTDPPNIINSQFFGYTKGYAVTDTLLPGKGYWVKMKSAGTMILEEK